LHEFEDSGVIAPVSRANQAAAFFKISRSSRSRTFSRRSCCSSVRSVVVMPSARRPSSRSAWRTQRPIACAVGSNSFASDAGERPARTNSTMRVLNSGGYRRRRLYGFSIVDPQSDRSTKPGQLHVNVAHEPQHEPRTEKLEV